jgi:hypothetical protein
MRRIAALFLMLGIGGTLLAGLGQTAAARTAATAKLRLLATNPVTVAGAGFHSRERVRVTASASDRTQVVRVVATRIGSFTADLDDLSANRCDLIRVVAVGNAGTRVVLKRLPAPACMPERSPG